MDKLELVTQICASSNRLIGWLRQLDMLRGAASFESRLIAFPYSCRRAIIGSMSEARRAGTKHASVATAARISDTAATVAM